MTGLARNTWMIQGRRWSNHCGDGGGACALGGNGPVGGGAWWCGVRRARCAAWRCELNEKTIYISEPAAYVVFYWLRHPLPCSAVSQAVDGLHTPELGRAHQQGKMLVHYVHASWAATLLTWRLTTPGSLSCRLVILTGS